eukprot:1533216-Rhodomonas_salina.1
MSAPFSISLSQSASILALITYIKTVSLCALRNAGQLLDRLVAKYLITGIQSVCVKGDSMPRHIHPYGLVDKNSTEEPYRAILDLRLYNTSVSSFHSLVSTVCQQCLVFTEHPVATGVGLGPAERAQILYNGIGR